jgi:hypothetical protein
MQQATSFPLDTWVPPIVRETVLKPIFRDDDDIYCLLYNGINKINLGRRSQQVFNAGAKKRRKIGSQLDNQTEYARL